MPIGRAVHNIVTNMKAVKPFVLSFLKRAIRQVDFSQMIKWRPNGAVSAVPLWQANIHTAN